MNIATYEFQYNIWNIDSINPSAFWITWIIFIILFMSLGIIFYALSPYFVVYKIMIQEEKEKTGKKDRIKELILMKEIQWDIEKEIEESLLNIWLKTSSLKS